MTEYRIPGDAKTELSGSVAFHRCAEEWMVHADWAKARNLWRAYRKFSRIASEMEQKALETIPAHRHRTRGIIAVSAVALMARTGKRFETARLAAKYLQDGTIPEWAKDEMAEVMIAGTRIDEIVLTDGVSSDEGQ